MVIIPMCCRQTVAKMDSERRSRSTCLSKMSTVSLDSGHVVVEVGDSLGYEARLVKVSTIYSSCVGNSWVVLSWRGFVILCQHNTQYLNQKTTTWTDFGNKCMALTSCVDWDEPQRPRPGRDEEAAQVPEHHQRGQQESQRAQRGRREGADQQN